MPSRIKLSLAPVLAQPPQRAGLIPDLPLRGLIPDLPLRGDARAHSRVVPNRAGRLTWAGEQLGIVSPRLNRVGGSIGGVGDIVEFGVDVANGNLSCYAAEVSEVRKGGRVVFFNHGPIRSSISTDIALDQGAAVGVYLATFFVKGDQSALAVDAFTIGPPPQSALQASSGPVFGDEHEAHFAFQIAAPTTWLRLHLVQIRDSGPSLEFFGGELIKLK